MEDEPTNDETSKQDPLLRRLYDLAAPQDGCVSTDQLASIGIKRGTLQSLVRRGALSRAAFGVYVLGCRELSDRQLLWTALLTAGPGSVISHWSAAALHGLVEARPGEAWVTTPQRRGDRTARTTLPVAATGLPGTIRIISARAERFPVLLAGIGADSIAQTMVSLAALEHPALVTEAWKEADYRNKLRADAIEQALGRGIAGTQVIRGLLRAHPIVSDEATSVATPTEFLLLAALLRLGVPRPLTNAPIRLPGATYFLDLYWRYDRYAVEVDGGVHTRPRRQAADGARDAHLARHGITVTRVADVDVERDADACARFVLDRWPRGGAPTASETASG